MHTNVMVYSQSLRMLYSFYIVETLNTWEALEGMFNLQLEVVGGMAYPPVPTDFNHWYHNNFSELANYGMKA